MRSSRQSLLVSEIDQIEAILNRLPESAAIERYSFEQRLAQARNELIGLPEPDKAPEYLRLTFRGLPVDRSHGIAVDFAGKASDAFADAFAALLAGRHDKLKYMGPIPDKAKFPLLITGTAIGSFGFEIELPQHHNLFEDEIQAHDVVETFKSLLRTSAEGTDDDVTELIDDVHPRAVRKVADFLDVLNQHGAWCGIEFRHDYFKYADIEELQRSEKRLKEENIKRSEETFVGEFQGVLPKGRTFEFRLVDGNILRGRIDKSIENPDLLNRDWLHRAVRVSFNVVQLGQGRPRYTLVSLANVVKYQN